MGKRAKALRKAIRTFSWAKSGDQESDEDGPATYSARSKLGSQIEDWTKEELEDFKAIEGGLVRHYKKRIKRAINAEYDAEQAILDIENEEFRRLSGIDNEDIEEEEEDE